MTSMEKSETTSSSANKATINHGEADNDRLNGGLGDDRLEGGAGTDQYTYFTGQGHDTLNDSDKLGNIVFDGRVLVGGLHRVGEPADTWKSLDNLFTYSKSDSNLLINNSLTIEKISTLRTARSASMLVNAPAVSTEAPSTVLTVVGDFDPLDTDPEEPGVQIGFDSLGNVIQIRRALTIAATS